MLPGLRRDGHEQLQGSPDPGPGRRDAAVPRAAPARRRLPARQLPQREEDPAMEVEARRSDHGPQGTGSDPGYWTRDPRPNGITTPALRPWTLGSGSWTLVFRP